MIDCVSVYPFIHRLKVDFFANYIDDTKWKRKVEPDDIIDEGRRIILHWLDFLLRALSCKICRYRNKKRWWCHWFICDQKWRSKVEPYSIGCTKINRIWIYFHAPYYAKHVDIWMTNGDGAIDLYAIKCRNQKWIHVACDLSLMDSGSTFVRHYRLSKVIDINQNHLITKSKI